MKKIILVDGNNLLFRAFYATAYTGNLMKNSKGFPTNAVYGFVNMINKIVAEENPVYMIVAFDKGKTFRHEKYDGYKDGRSETPDDLKMQFPIAKEILGSMGIKYYEIDNYEADDIIGTFAEYCNVDDDYIGTIISSDRDLLQLISDDIDIKLLKQKDHIRYTKESFFEEYGIEPAKIVDLKAIQGDSSDNIPGVKGIGEKGALKLLQEFGSLDGIYENIDKIKGKTREKLEKGRDSAYMSYDLATIIKDVPMEICIDDIVYKGPDEIKLREIYEELEFFSLIKKQNAVAKEELKVEIITDLSDLTLPKTYSIYVEILGVNYHKADILGIGVYDGEKSYFLTLDVLKKNPDFLKKGEIITYDVKKVITALRYHGIELENITFDYMIAGYLLDYNVKEDIAYLGAALGYDISFYETIYGKTKFVIPEEEIVAQEVCTKAKFIYETKDSLINQLKKEELETLYLEIEHPLAYVLSDMEYQGITVNKETLTTMGAEISNKIEVLTKEIHEEAGEEFNISSPIQLGEILFEKLGLPHGKKGKNGYSTAVDVLTKLQGKHPIIDKIMEYRILTKLHSTYIEGLLSSVMDDNKIHTIYVQTLARTGRLSSIEPNLQNIPIRYEYGRLIRKAFVPSKDSKILSSDYSQIELRILAHIAKEETLIEAFKNGMDIHTKTAMDVFKVTEVTSDMRRIAKAVNFGIIYGISSFGLAENLDITMYESKEFIERYLNTYPQIETYMTKIKEEAKENGFVRTLLGRKRNIPEITNKNYMIREQGNRIALNTPIQGTNADIIKKAMVEIHKYFKENNLRSKMILQVHDELVFDVLEEEMEIVKREVIRIMEGTYELSVPIKVEIEIGDTWYEAK